MKRIQTATIAAPGFLGLNTQESSIQLSSGYALRHRTVLLIGMVVLVQGVAGLL
jgi:hypothetical protein